MPSWLCLGATLANAKALETRITYSSGMDIACFFDRLPLSAQKVGMGVRQRVPRVMKFNGALRDANGTPRSGWWEFYLRFTGIRMGELPCGKRLKMCS